MTQPSLARPPIAGLIFDMDGVITDTAEYHYLSWKRLADEEGYRFSREDNDHLRGMTRRQSLEKLLNGQTHLLPPLPEAVMQEYLARKQTYFLEYLDAFTPENRLPGVTQILEQARAEGLRLGVASASSNTQIVLEKIDLISTFDVIGSSRMVSRPKPAPDLFVWVAGALGIPPYQIVVFEDSEAGIDGAKTAGCLTVGLGSAYVAHAHLVLPDLADVTLDNILIGLKNLDISIEKS